MVAFNNISVISSRPVLLVDETEVHGENYRPVASHRQTLSHNVVSSTSRHELTALVVIGSVQRNHSTIYSQMLGNSEIFDLYLRILQ
jgi:hypothetical protein